jgi:hypothetical protein
MQGLSSKVLTQSESDEADGRCQTAVHRPADFLLTINYCRRIVCAQADLIRLEPTRSSCCVQLTPLR